jgi:four helix bundle protein
MDEKTFKDRTKRFGLMMIRLVDSLPQSRSSDVLGRQIIRSGTSIGANYRAACRAKSTADMLNKLKIVEEEGDETLFWLGLLSESGLVPQAQLTCLMDEGNQLLAMTVASIKTLRAKSKFANRQP